jgi:hypothetical protein
MGGKEREGGKGGEMTQTLYAHMNKKKFTPLILEQNSISKATFFQSK